MFKVVWIARFPDGMANADARRHWAEVHAPLCASSSIPRYVQSHVTGPLPSPAGVSDDTTQFDGYSECWFRDEQAFLDALATPEWAHLREDGENVFDMSQMWGAALHERVVKAGAVPQPA